jgi:CheY-like chemotaxis protein
MMVAITSTAPLRILVVEDEALLAMDIGSIVEDAGHTVIGEAASLHDVERLDEETSPALAFVDVQLARNTSGLDVCALINRRWPKAFIVFLTANPGKVPDQCPGAHGIIAKPFTRGGMSAALRYVAEGILDPPPKSTLPPSFKPFASFEQSWVS